MDKKAKRAAAISAAVINYIYTEEEILTMRQAALESGQSVPGVAQTAPLPPFNIWSVSGRQAVMQTRNLMQLRVFGRGRQ
ncbi:MAG: hypothetical protein EHM30_11405 [Desulfobacteraceae bacterium]|nr:MAG: hypothetical protein EHM30_11405 [Desulfobacteraceae bacterium]